MPKSKQQTFDFAPRRLPAGRSRTSIAAARSMEPFAGTQEARVFAHVATCGERGATREEISTALAMRLHSVCARCNGLIEKGLLFDSGTERAGASGRKAVVLRAKGKDC